jgi:AAA family ATPase
MRISNIDRGNILKLLTEKMNLENIRITEIAERLHGFVASDICSLMKKAFLKSLELDKKLESDDILNCIKLITPSAMKTVSVSVQKVFWKDIGGSDSIRKSLCQLVEWPLKYPQKIKELGIRPPRGVLLYGPPGCSKTMIAKALATESDLKFLTIKV